jgi:hypothetical protein
MTATVRMVSGVLAVVALAFWGLFEVTGSSAGWIAGLVAGLAPLGVILWRDHRTPAMRRDQDVAARAVAGHRDPGPAYRAVADERARSVLAHPRSDGWLPTVLLLGLAVACVVTAVVREDVSVALPAVPLGVVAALVPSWHRRRTTAAARWLDDPPYAQGPA